MSRTLYINKKGRHRLPVQVYMAKTYRCTLEILPKHTRVPKPTQLNNPTVPCPHPMAYVAAG